ncbi:hypothetical protein BDV93DRAFT_522273 [Ceratobasidium sp. AG-I]|nr:hypothetical protein BDV93DRAFT_522273 [Ceratobasidium sp. AG-I]
MDAAGSTSAGTTPGNAGPSKSQGRGRGRPRGSGRTAATRVQETREVQNQNAVAAAAAAPELIARRNKRHVDELERSNYAEPKGSLDLAPGRTRTTLADEGSKSRKKATANVRTILLYRKNLNTIIEQSGFGSLPRDTATYLTAAAPANTVPPRTLCSVCSYWGRYKCGRCAQPYCDLACRAVHTDTRCERRIA